MESDGRGIESKDEERIYGGVAECNRWRKARQRESVRRKEIAGEFYTEERREKCKRATTLPAATSPLDVGPSVSRQDSKAAVEPIDHRSGSTTVSPFFFFASRNAGSWWW